MRKPPMPDCYDYVRRYYGVPAYIGARVRIENREGVLVRSNTGHYVEVRFDGERRASGPYHPTDGVEYLSTPPPADLVALVAKMQNAEAESEQAALRGDMAASIKAAERWDAACDDLLAYPLPAAPPVTDEHEAAAREIMTLLTPLVTDAAIVGRSYGWPDVLAVVRVVAAKLRPPVTDKE